MSGKRFTMEKVFRLWDDDLGTHIHIGEDGDGCDLVELRSVDANGKIIERVCLYPTQADAVAEGIKEVAAFILSRKQEAAKGERTP